MKTACIRRSRIIALALAASLLSCGTSHRASPTVRRIEIEDFFRMPEKLRYRLSPDGKRFAYLADYEGRENIFVRDVGSEESRRLTNGTDRDIGRFLWANDRQILYLQDDAGDEHDKLYRIDLEGGKTMCLTDIEDTKTFIVDRLEKFPDEILIGLNDRDPRLFDIYRLNIDTGERKLALRNRGDVRGWLADNKGVIRIISAGGIYYREDEGSEFREIVKTGPDETFSPEFFSSDNRRVYAYSNVGRDKIAIVEFDPGSAREVAVLFEDPAYDAFGDDEKDHFAYSPEKGALIYALYTAEKRTMHFFDRDTAEWYGRMAEKFGDYEVGIVSASRDWTKFVLMASSDRLEGAYYYFDATTESLELIHRATPWLEEEEMAEMTPIRFRSRDGLTLHGYLTLPRGAKPKNLPVVVHPHAGPQWRNSWGFDEKVQFLANRGFAVLQVNFRGSEGYGKEFLRAGFRQWGLKMQDDITDGVHWLIAEGIADPERIAILGWSFGGYAALAGVTFTPDLYACGVDMWGISDYFTWFESFPPYWSTHLDEIRERWGDPVADSVQMRETSPALNAEKIRAPLMIVQGENDPRVPVSQSDEMVEALRKNGKAYEYILIPGEGHAFSNPDKTIRLWREVEAFLEKHIGAAEPKT